ncbi:hypothetical protein FG386_002444 [Cryptosporidium ryanae]|uniref:uncharacterized protein n=1 Tax=Cryptosporidium ryanae TaxID=515981 RepID=UPI003519FBA3|nr:hypothetical protein FG386_002444 [Cryptosporidium ryanae]
MNQNTKSVNHSIGSIRNYVNEVIGKKIYLVLYKLGVELDDPIVIETATEALINYVELIGQISSNIAISAGRIHINVIDVKKAVRCIDNKRFEQLFIRNRLDSRMFANNLQSSSISERLTPTIHLNKEASWKEEIKNRQISGDKISEGDLLERVHFKPKHIPDFLPSFPPKISYYNCYKNREVIDK